MATKTVYQTDLISRVYLFPVEANELPFVPGYFNIPFGAFEDQPPEAPAGEVARRTEDGSEWEVVEDHRTDTFYLVATGEQYQLGSDSEVDGELVSYLGCGEPPAWLTLKAPEP